MKTFISLKSSACRTFQPARSAAASTLAGTCKRNVLVPWLVALAFALTAQQGHACTGEKDHALVEFDKLKKKKLTESEKQYIKSIEPVFRNYKGGGYNAIFGNK